jgi:hypothetical protein
VLRFERRLELDVWYVEHRSMALDLRIIAMTLRQVLARTHVSTTQDPEVIGFPLPGAAVAAQETAIDRPSDGTPPPDRATDAGPAEPPSDAPR